MKGEIIFYKNPGNNYRNTFFRGQFFLAPIPYLLEGRVSLLRIDYFNDSNKNNTSYSLVSSNLTNFRIEDIPDLHEVGVKKGEFVPFLRYKYRPVILLSNVIPNMCENEPEKGNCVFVAPLYSVRNEDGTYKFTQRFINQVQAYKYPSLFYLPEERTTSIEESIVRFDRIGIVKQENLKPIRLSLSKDGFYCLIKWLMVLLGEPVDEIIDDYRRAALSEIDKSSRHNG